jgi:hypothetical protein
MIDMPGPVDSNSPAYWRDGQLHVMNSTGANPLVSAGADQSHLGAAAPIRFNHINPWPTWMEALWQDKNGVIFGWYHQEHWGVCGSASRLAIPQIGAAISYDGGASFFDLGAILASGDATNCASQNGYFAGGVGDLSVMLDPDRKYFYFLFTNYAGPLETQGVSIARMPFANRFAPAGSVMKYFNGGWSEPGIHGRTTPIFPAKVGWEFANTDSFWGPSIHWNTYLKSYVVLLNRSCCTTGFPQKGIYASYSADLSDPKSWTKPEKVVADPGWYPQVLGEGDNGTDSVAGRVARLYIWGHSHLEIIFHKADPPADATTPQ